MTQGGIVMNLRTWLNDQLRRHTKPTAIELAQQQAALDAKYRQGGLDERYALLAQLAAEQQSKQAIDRALTPDPVSHPGDVLHEWNRANKPGYKPIRLLPAARDESWLNSKVIPWPPPVYEITEP